ncbi:MAG: hypothetical protein AAFO07_03115 [Bacteroidota bacterium]
MNFLSFDGQPFYLVRRPDHTSMLVYADQMNQPIGQLEVNLFVQQVKELHPGKEISTVKVLEDYDAYYYNKHRTKPLPVIKININDDKRTSYYIDPKTTNVLMKYEIKSRINRWLYHGLHSLDFPSLYFKRPLWDIIVIILMLGGTSVSITGLVLTYRWLKQKTQKKRRK